MGGGGEGVDVVAFENVEGGACDEVFGGVEVDVVGADTGIFENAIKRLWRSI